MKIAAEKLIKDLIESTRENLNQVEKFKECSDQALNYKENASSWSILECIEHLNLYGDYYLPEMEDNIANSKHEATAIFKSGVLGNYFAKQMLPKEGMKKMEAPKDKNPSGSQLEKSVIERFIKQQHKMLELLNKARHVSLTKTKTAISISKLIKLRLGDTFRFVIYHNQRHLAQAINCT
jgi:hypothetical protein